MDKNKIIRIASADLAWLKTRMASERKGPIYLLRIYVSDDGTVKFKFNEETWTLPMGESESDYEWRVQDNYEE